MRTDRLRLAALCASLFLFLSVSAQDAYRTNFTANVAQWKNVAIWQRFDQATNSWVAASHYPTADDGRITIQAGDSLQITGAGNFGLTIDEVTIDEGGVLVLFNNQQEAITLKDGPGDDMTVNGRLYVATAGYLVGSAKITVNSTGLFVVRNTGILNAYVLNNGTMHWGATGQAGGVFVGCLIENYNNLVWINGNVFFSSGTSVYNYGTMWMNTPTSSLKVESNGDHEKIYNIGKIIKTGTYATEFRIHYASTGTLEAEGSLRFFRPTNMPGKFIPTATPGILNLTLNNLIYPQFEFKIFSTGGVAGANYNQIVSTSAYADLSGGKIKLTDSGNDPVNTQYTLVKAAPGNVIYNGEPFATMDLPSNFVASVASGDLVVTKIAMQPLPVKWGEFTAEAKDRTAILNWSTLMEENTSHFIIEHSTGAGFTPIGKVAAKGNANYESRYTYNFTSPDPTHPNYFRIKQVDINGKSSYSATRSISFGKDNSVIFQAYPNPVKDILQLNIQTQHATITVNNLSGNQVLQRSVKAGQSTIDMRSLPAGVYYINLFEDGIKTATKTIIKQ